MKFIKHLLLLLFIYPLFIQAQQKDTLRMMTYNLLYYRENLTITNQGQTTVVCNKNGNNSFTAKESAMEDIFDYTLPDIFVVNEMGGSISLNAFDLLRYAINKNGRTNYSLANSTGIGQSLVNMLYYNTDKLVLEGQQFIDKDLNNNNLTRLIDLYTLRYKDTNLSIHQDTIRFHVAVAHLKASSGTLNENLRADATEAFMATIDSMNATGNYFFAGDLNLYRSSEPAYQDLTNYVKPNLRFYDPINISGQWSNSAARAFTHTQSTHTSSGCAAGGGMDDRFDFILVSDEVINNTDKVRYIPNTYRALGQDGNRYNLSIISPTNNSVPSLVSNALYNMSDHLPVLLDLEISIPSLVGFAERKLLKPLKFKNPTEGYLLLDFSNQKERISQVEILDISGKIVFSKRNLQDNYLELDVSYLNRGTYFIRITSQSFQQSVDKLIKI